MRRFKCVFGLLDFVVNYINLYKKNLMFVLNCLWNIVLYCYCVYLFFVEKEIILKGCLGNNKLKNKIEKRKENLVYWILRIF